MIILEDTVKVSRSSHQYQGCTEGGYMSYLRNPSFERGDTAWARINLGHAVTYSIRNSAGTARSGSNFLAVSTAEEAGSVGQDVVVPSPTVSVSCFAWVRAHVGQVKGSLTLWHLSPDYAVESKFVVGTDWKLVTCTLDFDNTTKNKTVRTEFYLSTINQELFIDSVNLF